MHLSVSHFREISHAHKVALYAIFENHEKNNNVASGFS